MDPGGEVPRVPGDGAAKTFTARTSYKKIIHQMRFKEKVKRRVFTIDNIIIDFMFVGVDLRLVVDSNAFVSAKISCFYTSCDCCNYKFLT